MKKKPKAFLRKTEKDEAVLKICDTFIEGDIHCTYQFIV